MSDGVPTYGNVYDNGEQLMSVFLVRDGKRMLWVAHKDDSGQFWVYVPNTRRFHRNSDLSGEGCAASTLTYEPISEATAMKAIKQKVGKLNERIEGRRVDRYRADTTSLEPEEVLVQLAAASTPSLQRRAALKAAEVMRAEPGEWVTWKTYPAADKRQTAHVAANSLRSGKMRALRDIGGVAARVVTTANGHVAVQLTRVIDRKSGEER